MNIAESSDCKISSSVSIRMTVHMGYSMDTGNNEIDFDPWRPSEHALICLSTEKKGTLIITLSLRKICPKWWLPLLAQRQQASISHYCCYKVNVPPWQPWGQKGQAWYNEPKPIVTVVTTRWQGDITQVVIIPCSENRSCSLSWESVSPRSSLTQWPFSVIPTLVFMSTGAGAIGGI